MWHVGQPQTFWDRPFIGGTYRTGVRKPEHPWVVQARLPCTTFPRAAVFVVSFLALVGAVVAGLGLPISYRSPPRGSIRLPPESRPFLRRITRRARLSLPLQTSWGKGSLLLPLWVVRDQFARASALLAARPGAPLALSRAVLPSRMITGGLRSPLNITFYTPLRSAWEPAVPRLALPNPR